MMRVLKLSYRVDRKALSVRLLHEWSRAAVRFDEENLVSCAGLVPVMCVAERAGLSDLVADKVKITGEPVPSTGANPAGKVTSIVAGVAAGADSIDDLDVLRHGGMKRLFAGVYAPSTLGSFLRAFTHGHVLQLAAVLRSMLVGLAQRTPMLRSADQLTFVDIDSLLTQALATAKMAGARGMMLVRADSAYYAGAIVSAARRAVRTSRSPWWPTAPFRRPSPRSRALPRPRCATRAPLLIPTPGS
jgi:hypothetical protein